MVDEYQSIIKGVLAVISIVMILLTFIPLVRNDYWTFRALEFPRSQKLIVNSAVLLLWATVLSHLHSPHWVLITLLAVSIIYLAYKVMPYTSLYAHEMVQIKNGSADSSISLFCANVYQDNRDYETMRRQILECDPDVIFLVETDKSWAKEMKLFRNRYPHYLEQPQENTYGLLFYSKLPLEEGSVKFLVKNEIPSVEAAVTLPSGQKVKIFGLHPEPPAPQESLTTTAKDKELMKIAFKAAKSKHPVIVMGDLNDVAWSYTTELFRKTSRLLDPRRGRGFFATFSAKSRIMRFPLDYIFCSETFGLIEMKRMPYSGSDHFAMFVKLQYDKTLAKEQTPPQADADDIDDAREKAAA
ncbi:endonuclease/exonuclease/phosphatase family protein [Polluticoccus soli]|uniref:endonuclease/exonuclease/phosphatase family protein n=1 Tax=Polluticoccus soli TaxID=3034150 RepID=UPI0023E24424|nr:endonuclease/exonuclease/phosphatase family protein [Flavipsychrobacter sp. JY13-12]